MHPEGHRDATDDEKNRKNQLLWGKGSKRVASDKMRTGRCSK